MVVVCRGIADIGRTLRAENADVCFVSYRGVETICLPADEILTRYRLEGDDQPNLNVCEATVFKLGTDKPGQVFHLVGTFFQLYSLRYH